MHTFQKNPVLLVEKKMKMEIISDMKKYVVEILIVPAWLQKFVKHIHVLPLANPATSFSSQNDFSFIHQVL